MHPYTQKKYVSLTKEFQKYQYNDDRKHGVMDQVKDRKIASKRKWIDIEYHVQGNADVAHKDVKCIVILNNSHHFHSVVHIQSLMEQGGWVRIII